MEELEQKVEEKENKKSKKEKKLKQPKKKMRLKKWVWIVFLGIFLILLIYSGMHYFNWSKENKDIETQMKEIENLAPIEELEEDPENVEIVNPPEEEPTPDDPSKPVPESDYKKYIKIPLIDVDLTELKNKNSDTVAWLKVNGTNINYPVVQAADNEFYLDHAFDKSSNSAGWVFMDYRNNINDFDDNTIIYAHGRQNNTMFGSLKNILESNWYKDTDNYVVHLSTETQNTLWQVVSIYVVPEETYYLTSQFGTTESKQKFLDTILSRSSIDFGTTLNTNDKILTLSTCYNHVNRVVLHAKLIKKAPAA